MIELCYFFHGTIEETETELGDCSKVTCYHQQVPQVEGCLYFHHSVGRSHRQPA